MTGVQTCALPIYEAPKGKTFEGHLGWLGVFHQRENIINKEYSYSEEWRRICEATSTLKTPLAQRRKYLAGVEKHRGKKAREELEQEMIKQHRLMKCQVS